MPKTQLNILLVDDQDLIRTGFALILGTEESFTVVGEAADGGAALEAIETLAAENRVPDVVLMDVRMPGMDGIEATKLMTERYPEVKVLVLTTFDLDEYALAAIEAGASGFLLKDARAAELIAAVHAVAEGDSVMAPSVTRRLIARLREPERVTREASMNQTTILEQLTEREQQVFGLIAEGLSNVEIGESLFLSESTVKTHVGRVLAKLGLRDRVHAVIFAYEAGVR